jgi:hypothetical protein
MPNIVGQKIDVKVYIEGHLIPCQRITVTLYDGQTSFMSIDTTPENSMKKIPPMSLVSVFYFDNNVKDWCLLWEGFYTGWQFSRAASGRSISLMAMDWTGLFQKTSALMLGNDKELINMSLEMFGMGNSQPQKMGKNRDKATEQQLASLAFSYFQPRGIMDFPFMAQTILKQTEGTNNSFSKMALALVEALMWLNPLLYYRFDKSKMIKKFTSTKDENLFEFYEAELLRRALTDIGASYFNGKTSADKIVAAWEAQMYYSRSTLCAPPFVKRFNIEKGEQVEDEDEASFTHFIWHPKAYFGIPPACNVIFPEFITNISYSRNYMAETTRMLMKTTPMVLEGTGVYAGYFYSEQNEILNSKEMYEKMKALPQNLYMSQFSAEEFEKYVNPATHTLNSSLYHVLINQPKEKPAKGKDALEKLQKMIGSVTHFMFLQKKYGNRPITVSGQFNPYFTVAYPCLVFDGKFQFLAKPISVTHIINTNGNATTQYMCNFALDLDEDDLTSDIKFPPLPGWLPEAYRPQKINETYENLLGKNRGGAGFSALQAGGTEDYKDQVNPEIDETVNPKVNPKSNENYGVMGVGTSRANVAVLANSLFSLDRTNPAGDYDNSENKIEFARSYVLRSLTTMKQYAQFYNFDESFNEPPEFFGKTDKTNVFNHIVGTREGLDGTLLFLKEEKATEKPNMDDTVKKEEENSGSAQAFYNTNKYDKMSLIQEAVKKKGFKG